MSTYKELGKYNHRYLQKFSHYVLENGIVIPIEAVANINTIASIEATATFIDINANLIKIHNEAYIHVYSSTKAKQALGVTNTAKIKSDFTFTAAPEKHRRDKAVFRVNTNFEVTPELITAIFKEAGIDATTGFIANPVLCIAKEANIDCLSEMDLTAYKIDYKKDLSILRELQIQKEFECDLKIPVYKQK